MNNLYTYDEVKVEAVRNQKLWMQDAKYFKRVKISPSATIKMMTHGQQGVDKGVKKSGKPIEVMGLLLGRPDTEDPHCLIVSDAQALPIEGFETRVVADDVEVVNYMIELGDSLEISRKERFCGWYHTHPFDLDVQSNCFLSNTDLSTQLQWQRAEDPHGNPWLAIVIDPLYSIAKARPEMMAFRVYPPDYNPPANETPDGTIVHDDHKRLTKWGACWNRYYKLDISFFMSDLSKGTLGILKDKLLWHNTLCTTAAKDSEHQTALTEQISSAISRVEAMDRRGGYDVGSVAGGDEPAEKGVAKTSAMNKVAGSVGTSECCELHSQLAKHVLFGQIIPGGRVGLSSSDNSSKMEI